MEVPAFSPAGLDSENLEKEKDWAQKIEQVKDFLEKEVDFSVIADIIGDILKKCYPEISDETVKARLEEIYRPRYEVFYEDSLLDDDKVPDNNDGIVFARSGLGKLYFYARPYFSSGKLNKAELMHLVIHECLHLASTTFVNLNNVALVTGVSKTNEIKSEEKLPVRNFNSLNEGLTEIITDCIYSEYFSRTGNLAKEDYKKEDEESGIKYGPVETLVLYVNERIEVLSLLGDIHQLTNIPIDDVVRSIVAEYFKGEGIDREEMLEIYKDYPELKEFMDRHKNNLVANYNDKAHEFINEDLPSRERVFVHALFGRDEIGAYNSRIRENK